MLSPFLEWNIIFSRLECIRHVVETGERFLRSAEAGVLCHSAEARLSAGERIAACALSTIAAAEEFYSVGYDVSRIDCDTFSVFVASGLDPAGDADLEPLWQLSQISSAIRPKAVQRMKSASFPFRSTASVKLATVSCSPPAVRA